MKRAGICIFSSTKAVINSIWTLYSSVSPCLSLPFLSCLSYFVLVSRPILRALRTSSISTARGKKNERIFVTFPHQSFETLSRYIYI